MTTSQKDRVEELKRLKSRIYRDKSRCDWMADHPDKEIAPSYKTASRAYSAVIKDIDRRLAALKEAPSD